MSFEHLRYDTCSYEERLKATTSPGVYMLNRPNNDCDICDQDIPVDPYMRYQTWGPTTCPPGAVIDDHSELLGLPRKASECTSKQHLRKDVLPEGKCKAPSKPLKKVRDCRPPTEPTRLSNPPCTLRSTGINRWEWLCDNPQDKAIIPFEWNVNYRIIAKDNHRPCYPTPLDPTPVLPQDYSEANTVCASGAYLDGPGRAMTPSWRSCEAIKQM